MHGRTLVPPIAWLLLLLGCGEPRREPPARDEPSARVQAPTPAREPASSGDSATECTVGAPRTVLSSAEPVVALGLAHGEGGTVLVAAVDATTLEWVALDEHGAPGTRVRSRVPHARSLVVAAPWGERAVAIGHGPCPEPAEAASCLQIAALERGRALEPIAIPLPAPVERIRVASSESLFVVARSHRDGPPYADVVRLERGRLVFRSDRLGDARWPGELHAEALAAAVSGDRYAVAVRAGAIEDPAGALLLATRERVVPLEPLHEAAMVDALVFDPARPGTVALLASFEWSRPHVLRFELDGTLVGRAVEVPHGGTADPVFGSNEVGRLERDATGLALHRRTRGGDPLGAQVRVAGPDAGRAALAKREGDYLVALAPGAAGPGVRTMRLTCAAR